jgi:hypothetical protein
MALGSIGRWYRSIPWYGSGKLWLVDVHGQGRRSLSLSVFFDVFHRFWTGDEAVVDAVSPETMQSPRD